MRLWHQDLIKKLSREHLLSQHRECCALRGKGWMKPHSTVNYVFKYNPCNLYLYHFLVMKEMKSRGYYVHIFWETPRYRGKKLPLWEEGVLRDPLIHMDLIYERIIYPEHNPLYLRECIINLRYKSYVMGEKYFERR